MSKPIYSASPQKGIPGHCYQAQIFKNGKAFLSIEPTEDEKEATQYASEIAEFLNKISKDVAQETTMTCGKCDCIEREAIKLGVSIDELKGGYPCLYGKDDHNQIKSKSYSKVQSIDISKIDQIISEHPVSENFKTQLKAIIDNSWLSEDYLKSLGYYKIKDDGQYGIYKNEHWIVKSPTYGNLPKDYRRVTFNRDAKIGVFLGVEADWGTRYSFKNVVAINKEIFEILLNSAC